MKGEVQIVQEVRLIVLEKASLLAKPRPESGV